MGPMNFGKLVFGWGFLGTTILLSGCASQRVAEGPTGTPVRYLAWLQGDVENNFEPDREIARQELGRWAEKPPSLEEKDSYLDYLSLLEASGNKEQAETKIKEYLTLYPEELRAVFILAVHELRNQKKELARYLFHRLEKNKNFAWRSLAINNLAMLELQEGQEDVAVALFEQAMKTEPPVAAPWVNLGALLLKAHSYAKAETLFTQAQKLDPQFEAAALGLGVALEGQGKFEAAHKVYERFRDLGARGLEVTYNDSILLGNRMGRRAEAAQLMLRYLQQGGKETAKAQKELQNWR